MAQKTIAQLKQDIIDNVTQQGADDRITGTEVRTVLTDIVDSLINNDVVQTIQVYIATDAGVREGDIREFKSISDAFIVHVKPTDSAPRIAITVPAGKEITHIVDSTDGEFLEDYFDRNGQTWLANDDFDDTSRLILIQLT